MNSFDQPWGWAAAQRQRTSNMLAPLGAGAGEPNPGVITVEPSASQKALTNTGLAVAGKATDQAVDFLTKPDAMPAIQDSATKAALFGSEGYGEAADAATRGAEAATEGAEAAAGVASNSIPFMGLAMGLKDALAQGKYGKLIGTGLGSAFGPLGAMAGGAIGGMLGFADGTPTVPPNMAAGARFAPELFRSPLATANAATPAVRKFIPSTNRAQVATRIAAQAPVAPINLGYPTTPQLPQWGAGYNNEWLGA